MDGGGAGTRYRVATIHLYSTILALGNILLGVLVLAGGGQRMAGASFQYVVHIAPYWLWGAAFLFGGVAVLVGQHFGWRWVVRVGHSSSGMACFFWTGAFIYGAIQSPTPWTGIAAYATLGALHSASAGLAPARVVRGRR